MFAQAHEGTQKRVEVEFAIENKLLNNIVAIGTGRLISCRYY
jgi:hypothetical protein